MEKISKEELMKKLNLSDEDILNVSGGAGNSNCDEGCLADYYNCVKSCTTGLSCVQACLLKLINDRPMCISCF